MIFPTGGAFADDRWRFDDMPVVFVGNDRFRVMLLPDKGADIASIVVRPGDVELLWQSPRGWASPRHHLPSTGHPEATWLDLYEGGWQSVFPNGGWACSYDGADLGLHAESTLVPWRVQVTEPGPETAVVRADVELVRTPLRATRTLTVRDGSPSLVIDEVITNTAGDRFPISYGQHIVFGAPFLSPSTIVDMPGGTVRAHPDPTSSANTVAAGAVAAWPHMPTGDGGTRDLRAVMPPTARTDDLLYHDDLEDGWYAVTNPDLGIGVGVRFPRDLYRHVWRWEVFGGAGGYPWWGRTYSLGLEPFTSATSRGLAAAVDDGTAVWLEPGESVRSRVLFTVFAGSTGAVGIDADGGVRVRPPRADPSETA
jgi:hypothetical protein